MDPRLPALERLVRELRRLLDVLDAEAEGEEPLAAAWERCERAFAGFRALQEATGGTPPAEVRERIEDALRLHAVALSSARRRQGSIEEELAAFRGTRRRLKEARTFELGSSSCDVRG